MNIINKDLLTVTTGTIIHQVCTSGYNGGGLTNDIFRLFPKVWATYTSVCDDVHVEDRFTLLGHAQFVEVAPRFTIISVFGQLKESRSGVRSTEYSALASAFSKIKDKAPQGPIFIPNLIGCGCGGGEVPIVESIIKRYLNSNRLWICTKPKL